MNLRVLWDGPRALTWLTHFLMGSVMAWALAWWFPMAFYSIREAEGLLYSGPHDWTDHLMDVLAPSVAGLIAWRLQ
jgi:hypothetical protein